MRVVQVKEIEEAIAQAVQEINFEYSPDILHAMQEAKSSEDSEIGKEMLDILLKNAEIAKRDRIAVCQDTGMVVVFAKIGQEVHLVGGSLKEAIHRGVATGYEEGYLRKSIVDDPLFNRINTKDNTPAVIYTELVEGDQIQLTIGCKGFGSENTSTITMLKPAQGVLGVKEAVLSAVKNAGPNACPPFVVGVGIGGTFDYAAVLAKLATFQEQPNPNPEYRQLEEELLEEINHLGIGPQGLGGKTTALKLHILEFPTHIAGLPVAVNISCHITRHKEIVL